MKPKYVFYLLLLLVMHYEVSRIVDSRREVPVDDSALHDTGFDTNNRDYSINSGHKLHVVKIYMIKEKYNAHKLHNR